MIWAGLLAAGWLAPPALGADGAKTEIREEIKVRGKAPGGPPLQVPPPDGKAAADEVIRSLDIYRADHKLEAPKVKMGGLSKRLDRPFPEPPYLSLSPALIEAPYDAWTFEVLQGATPVWRGEGEGRLKERLEWDGSGSLGDNAIKVGRAYHFRFRAREGEQQFVLTSEPVTLKSLVFKETLGGSQLEVANSVLFATGKPSFKKGSETYLDEMGARMRRVSLGKEPYRLVLYQDKPKSALARQRADRLARFFAKYLVLNPKRVEVSVRTPGERGDVTSCALPAETGATIRME